MQTKSNKDETLRQLEQYLLKFPEVVDDIIPLVSFTKDREELFDRKVQPGHITASGFVLHPNKPDHILIVYHQTLQKWLQPGGHVDSGETPEEAAIREVKEETEAETQLHPSHLENIYPFDINVHYIPTKKEKDEAGHFHYDFRYLLTTEQSDLGRIEKNHLVRWIDINGIKDKNLARAIEQIQAMG